MWMIFGVLFIAVATEAFTVAMDCSHVSFPHTFLAWILVAAIPPFPKPAEELRTISI